MQRMRPVLKTEPTLRKKYGRRCRASLGRELRHKIYLFPSLSSILGSSASGRPECDAIASGFPVSRAGKLSAGLGDFRRHSDYQTERYPGGQRWSRGTGDRLDQNNAPAVARGRAATSLGPG